MCTCHQTQTWKWETEKRKKEKKGRKIFFFFYIFLSLSRSSWTIRISMSPFWGSLLLRCVSDIDHHLFSSLLLRGYLFFVFCCLVLVLVIVDVVSLILIGIWVVRKRNISAGTLSQPVCHELYELLLSFWYLFCAPAAQNKRRRGDKPPVRPLSVIGLSYCYRYNRHVRMCTRAHMPIALDARGVGWEDAI